MARLDRAGFDARPPHRWDEGVSEMTSQIKMATFAFLAGLAIALLLQAPSVVGADDAKLFDASNLSNPKFLGYWTARLAAVLLICVKLRRRLNFTQIS